MKEAEVPTREEIWNLIKDKPVEDWVNTLILEYTTKLPAPTIHKLVMDLSSYDHPKETPDAGGE